MITRDALYQFVEGLIAASVDGDPLFEAQSFRNLRGDVDAAAKVVRVECVAGQHAMSSSDKTKEMGVEATIQFWVNPADASETALDEAIDLSFAMSRQAFEAIATNTTLGGLVCDCYFDGFENGFANLGTSRRGVTYMDGVINHTR